MGSELSIVAWNGLLLIATIFVQATLATPQLGIPYLNSPRDEGLKLTGVAARLDRAAQNALIGFALLAAAVLVLQAQGRLGGVTLTLCQVILACRVGYVIAYAAGIPYLRTALWLGSIGATTWLLILAL